jgi:hypothetical protein
MRKTTDTKTGKPFRWNVTILIDGLRVPARRTSRGRAHLTPDRVLPQVLWRLNREATDIADLVSPALHLAPEEW